MPGAKLAALVTRHMRTVFAEHRRVLEDDYDYRLVSRQMALDYFGSPGAYKYELQHDLVILNMPTLSRFYQLFCPMRCGGKF